MLCWLAFGEHEAIFLEENGGSPMQSPSAAPPWEAQMLCWPAFGEQEAIFLEENGGRPMQTPSAAPLGRPKMLCWLASGEHEDSKEDVKRVGILILAYGIPTSTTRVFPPEHRDNTLRRPPLGRPKCFAG